MRSIVNKFSKFQSFVYASNFCITETWLSDFISNGEILPSGFVIHRKDRPSRGGGVLVASLYSSSVCSPSNLEIVSVKMDQSSDHVICCIYVPPDSPLSYVSSLVLCLSDLVSSFSKCG